jgi:hypothetical protein
MPKMWRCRGASVSGLLSLLAMKIHLVRTLLASFFVAALGVHSMAAEGEVPASAEVAAVMQPYLDSHKLAGIVSIIAVLLGAALAGRAICRSRLPRRCQW